MALVGMNNVVDESFGTSFNLDSSLNSISPIRDAGGQNYALAAMVADHHRSDGRESMRSDDSGSATRIKRAQLELEMAETEERLVEAQLRKQKAKLQVVIAQSASGSNRSRTSRSLLDRQAAHATAAAAFFHPLVKTSMSDDLERDLSAIMGESFLREHAEKSMIQRARDEAVAVERFKHQQYEQQLYVEQQAERAQAIRQVEYAEHTRLMMVRDPAFLHAGTGPS